MKSIQCMAGLIILMMACGFLKQKEDGSFALEAASQTNATAEMKQQAEAVAEEAATKGKELAQSLEIKTEQIMADLAVPIENLKKKVAALDQAQLQAYAEKYKTLLMEKKQEIADATQHLKELPLTKKLGAEARQLKEQLAGYQQQLSGLTEQYAVYLNQLKLTAPEAESGEQ